MPGFQCSRCGEYHDELPLAFRWPAPDPWMGLTEAERQAGELSSELCAAGENRFIHGLLDLPIIDGGGVFTYGVWVSLSPANWDRAVALWEKAGRENEPPYFGWLCTSLLGYPDTFNLKTNVHTHPVGERPLIELEPTDHPLAVAQRNGITLARAQELAEGLLHS